MPISITTGESEVGPYDYLGGVTVFEIQGLALQRDKTASVALPQIDQNLNELDWQKLHELYLRNAVIFECNRSEAKLSLTQPSFSLAADRLSWDKRRVSGPVEQRNERQKTMAREHRTACH
jgi:hypothetical protein